VQALVRGDIGSFLAHSPAYGGSLLIRAPFALLSIAWGAGAHTVYASLAAPCLLAAIALGLWLVRFMTVGGRSRGAKALVLVLCTANPLTLLALEIGHPEELLGGVLCVTAVLLASRGRWALAGLALGVAVANKPWALVAVGPVLVALPAQRAQCLGVAGAACGAIMGPFLLLAPSSFVGTSQLAATSTGSIFQPWQLWWFLGHAAPAGAHVQHTIAGADRLAPGWIGAISRPLIVLLPVPLSLFAWRRRSWRAVPLPDAMLLLALLLLLRCMLDPWDSVYYAIPFVLGLVAWQALAGRPPLLAATATVAVMLNHGWMASLATPDAEAIAFAAWSVPLCAFLAFELFGRSAASPHIALRGARELRPAAATAPSEPDAFSRSLSTPSAAS